MNEVTIEYLAQRREWLPLIADWFEAEWPTHYGAGGTASARDDLLRYCNRGGVPLGLVAMLQGAPCGFAALKHDPFPSHPHLAPWAGAAVVPRPLRRQGIGRALLQALLREARTQGYARVYCATATSDSLLQREQWQWLDCVPHEGQRVSVYQKAC